MNNDLVDSCHLAFRCEKGPVAVSAIVTGSRLHLLGLVYLPSGGYTGTVGAARSQMNDRENVSMEPNMLLIVVASLACPIGMGVMMWMMNKRMGEQRDPRAHEEHVPASVTDRLARLGRQRQKLEEEIAEATRLVEPGAGRDVPRSSTSSLPGNPIQAATRARRG